jgi:hypothetical protein
MVYKGERPSAFWSKHYMTKTAGSGQGEAWQRRLACELSMELHDRELGPYEGMLARISNKY